MATKKITLPSFKVTRRPAFGKKTVQFIEREVGLSGHSGAEQSEDASTISSSSVSALKPEQADVNTLYDVQTDMEVPTGHELESRASAVGWESIRRELRVAVTEMASMPLSQVCLYCNTPASVKCKQCGPKGFYCHGCFVACHSNVNIYHVAEKWEVGYV